MKNDHLRHRQRTAATPQPSTAEAARAWPGRAKLGGFLSSPRAVLLATSLALLALGCHPDTLVHAYQPLPTSGWQATDTLRFDLIPLEADGTYEASVELRVTQQMAYRNLTLVLEQRDGHNRLRDTVNLPLADARGNWLTRGATFHEFQSPPLPLSINTTDSTHLLLYHIMPHQTLTGVAEAGIRVAKSPLLGIGKQKKYLNILENHQK